MNITLSEVLNSIKELRKESNNKGTALPLYNVYEEKTIVTDDTDLADVKTIKVMLGYWDEVRNYTIEEINDGIMSEDMLLSRRLTEKLRYCETIDEALEILHQYFSKDEVWKGGLMYEDKYVNTFLTEQDAKKYINLNNKLENPYVKVTSAITFGDSSLEKLLRLIDE